MTICRWCNEPIDADNELIIVKDGDGYIHLSCLTEENDDAMFDTDMGFGCDRAGGQ